MTLKDMVDSLQLSETAARFLLAMFRARMNVLLAGPQEAGHVTLLNALLAHVRAGDRVVTCELSRVLYVPTPAHQLMIVARPSAMETEETKNEELVLRGLRQVANGWMILPHLNTGAVVSLLKGISTPRSGVWVAIDTASSGHLFDADAAGRDISWRTKLRDLAATRRGFSQESYQQVVTAFTRKIDYVVELGLVYHNGRFLPRLLEISEVLRSNSSAITTQPIFQLCLDRSSQPQAIEAQALHTQNRPVQLAALEEAGCDLDLLKQSWN